MFYRDFKVAKLVILSSNAKTGHLLSGCSRKGEINSGTVFSAPDLLCLQIAGITGQVCCIRDVLKRPQGCIYGVIC
jgi:hypothetical protein